MTAQWWQPICAAAIVLWCVPLVARSETATFDDHPLAANSYWDGSNGSGGFTSAGAFFPNSYTAVDDPSGYSYFYWNGWTYSDKTDTTTPGYGNQYSAITGTGAQGSANYAIGYDAHATGYDFASPLPTVTLPHATTVLGAYFTNSTYAYWSMKLGDQFAKQFGGPSGTDPDWFKLTITGEDASGKPTGTPVDFYLADYRSATKSLIDKWTWVDLTSLGNNVSTLQFDLISSDINNANGMNTPAYFAMDNLTIAPEPSTMALLATALFAAMGLWRQEWRRQ